METDQGLVDDPGPDDATEDGPPLADENHDDENEPDTGVPVKNDPVETEEEPEG